MYLLENGLSVIVSVHVRTTYFSPQQNRACSCCLGKSLSVTGYQVLVDLEDLRPDVKREMKMADKGPEAPYGLIAMGAPQTHLAFLISHLYLRFASPSWLDEYAAVLIR